MSFLYVDSFDGYVTSEIPIYWTDMAISATASIVANPRTGTSAMQPRAGGVARSLGSGFTDIIIAAAFHCGELNQDIFQFTQSGPTGTVQVKLSVGANGRLVIHPASGAAAVADASQLVTNYSYNFIEWQTGFTHASVNKIWINGQLVISTALDCQATFLGGADTFFLLGAGGGGGQQFDDLYVMNPDDATGHVAAVGDSSVICGIPNSDGFYTEWAMHPVQIAHYLNVKEIPSDGNSSYNSSTGANSRDTYNVTPSLATTDKVLAVQLTELTGDFDGDGFQTHAFVRVQGVNFPDPNDYTPGAYAPVPTMFEANPITVAFWTPAQVNGTEWGIQQV